MRVLDRPLLLRGKTSSEQTDSSDFDSESESESEEESSESEEEEYQTPPLPIPVLRRQKGTYKDQKNERAAAKMLKYIQARAQPFLNHMYL